MTLFSRILVGIDDSDASNDAVVLAARLAREHAGQLMLAHSVNWMPIVTQMVASGTIVDTSPMVDDLKQEGEALLVRAVETARQAGVEAQQFIRDGEPTDRLLELAAETHCSAIVLGMHGRGMLEGMFTGSVMEGVLRASTIPVLTVRSGLVPAAPARRCFERILVGIDDSEPSEAAVATVLDLPPEDRAHVYFYSVAGSGDGRHEQAERIVGKALAAADARGVAAKGRAVAGNPVEALLAAAQETQADLIVLGSHGRRGLQRLFLGSVAEHVVRNAPLPVLVVRTAHV
jgi:nucleotide-binding universal stress UspA family protein